MRAFIDLQDDVTTKDLGLAVQEGYRSVEHAKRYTTAGMGTDQGKVANLNAFGFLASVRGESDPGAIGTTTFRQPYKPVTFAALAGQHVGDRFAPRRTTPMHDWHRAERRDLRAGRRLAARARLSARGRELSRRPCSGNRRRRARRSACSTHRRWARSTPGPRCCEAAQLGLYEPVEQAGSLGSARYGLMLDENGMIFDDGVTVRLADQHYMMTTTTGGAARVLDMARALAANRVARHAGYGWASVTDHWADVSQSVGPNSRKRVLQKAVADIDFANPAAFPFMSYREGQSGGGSGVANHAHQLFRRTRL